jgi:hypothetical protein
MDPISPTNPTTHIDRIDLISPIFPIAAIMATVIPTDSYLSHKACTLVILTLHLLTITEPTSTTIINLTMPLVAQYLQST